MAQPTISLSGDKKLDRALKAMGPKLTKKILRKAVRRAAKPVLTTARARVPIDEGDLKRSLKIRAMKRSRRNRFRVGLARADSGRS